MVEMGSAPSRSCSVIISVRPIDPCDRPVANSHLYLTTPEVVEEIVKDVERVWNELLLPQTARLPEGELKARITGTMFEHNCLPSQLFGRLAKNHISG